MLHLPAHGKEREGISSLEFTNNILWNGGCIIS